MDPTARAGPSGHGVSRSLLLLAALFCWFALAAGAEAAREPMSGSTLLRVRVESGERWELLRSVGAEVFLRGDGYAVIRVPAEKLEFLTQSGSSWRLLSRDPRGPLYYLLSEREAPSPASLGLEVLDRDAEGFLAVVPPAALSRVREAGYKTVALDRPLPFLDLGFLDLHFVHDEVLRNEYYYELTRLVNQDTLASYVGHLQGFGTRHSDSPQIALAGRWLVNSLARFGYPDTVFESIDFGKGVRSGPVGNVRGWRPGRTHPEVRILVGGHYDSMTYGQVVPPTEVAPGADDNGSGTAGALEVARVLASVEMDATVEYVFFSGEEQGLVGSRRLATQFAAQGMAADQLFFINMDMIGNASVRPWRMRIYTDRRSRPLAELTAAVARAYTEIRPLLPGNSGLSDHASFQQVGYPAIFLHEGDQYDFLHTVDDLLENLEVDYMAEVVRVATATVLHLARVTGPPADVVAYQTESGGVAVEWAHATDADVTGYYVELLGSNSETVGEFHVEENRVVLEGEDVAGALWVRVRAEDVLGRSEPSEAAPVTAGSRLTVASVAPNPTRGEVAFLFFVPGSGGPVRADLTIVDAMGRVVKRKSAPALARGSQKMSWDGRLSDGTAAPSGIYFYALEVAGFGLNSGKITVVR